MDGKPRILFISSVSFSAGPGPIALTIVRNLRAEGFDTDVLTLYRQQDYPDFRYVKDHRSRWADSLLLRGIRKVLGLSLPGSPHYFFYRDETHPPVPVRKVLKQIDKPYELVIIYFWQELLSFRTVEKIYDKLGKPVVFCIAADYSMMAGGCHFSIDCDRFETGCGRCPAIRSHRENDFTRRNVRFRQHFYEKVKPVIFANSYMMSFFRRSLLLKDARIEKDLPGLELGRIHPVAKPVVRKKFDVPEDVRFILGFGCQDLTDPRKGMDYLVEALNQWHRTLGEARAAEVMVVAVGKNFDSIGPRIPFRSLALGTVPYETLSEFYSLIDIFVCPSVDDAGPSMVLQSISYGTPVVGFEMGAMIDFVKDRETGFCARLRDAGDLAGGIDRYYRLTAEERAAESAKCREMVATLTYPNMFRHWMELYRKYAE